MNAVIYVVIGMMAGIFGGIFGLGGGIIMVPAMVVLLGLTQHQAQGTSLAIMVPPIALLAAWKYYVSGNVRLDIALYMCLGFFIGGYFGAVAANNISGTALSRLFGLVMFVVSIKLILGK